MIGAGFASPRVLLALGTATTVCTGTLVPVPPPVRAAETAISLRSAVLPLDPGPAPDPTLAALLLEPLAATAPQSISDAIIAVYLTLQEWADYGVELLSWALRWLPFGGLLAAQLNMFYDLGESVVSSVVFNTAYLIGGSIDIGEALSNVGSALGAALNTWVNDEIAWFRGLLPPLPPLAALDVDAGMPDPGALTDLAGFPDPGGVADVTPELAGILLDLPG